jgi:erythromycin esterase-like protein
LRSGRNIEVRHGDGRHKAPSAVTERAFRRFPTWMWRNVEVDDFVDWLRAHNEGIDPARRAGFFGLDIYNMSASIRAVIDYLDRVDPEAARVARERYGCLTPWQNNPATYGRAALSGAHASRSRRGRRSAGPPCARGRA